jgi:nitrite reductase/ring-hydroxylating ferredoxin subunit
MAGKPGGAEPTTQAATELCAVDDIPDGGSGGFFVDTADGRLLYMAIRRGGRVFVYVNSCPHTGMPLDYQPGRFLNADGTLIQCSTHGAEFRIDDGYCVSGPCEGDRLRAVNVKIRRGKVFIGG